MKEFYLARSSNGNLVLFNQKPYKKHYVYNSEFFHHIEEFWGWTTKTYEQYGLGSMAVDSKLYSEVTFENSPKKVTFKIE